MKKTITPIEIVAWIPSTPLVIVKGQSGTFYTVNHEIQNCTCRDFKWRARHQCKHLAFILPLVPHRAILEAAQMERFAAESVQPATAEAEPDKETFFCERCGTEKSGDSHCVDEEITVCAACYADSEKGFQESMASLYKDEG